MALVKSEAVAASEEVVQLELAVYERYCRAGVLYTRITETGRQQIYNFTKSQASILLTEVDESTGRPIWRKPRKVARDVQREVDRNTPSVIDATKDITPELAAIEPMGRIDVGSDEELREILGADAEDIIPL